MRNRLSKSFALAAIVGMAGMMGMAALSFSASAAFAASGSPQTFGIAHATFLLPGVMAAGQPTGEQIQLLAEEGNYHAVIDLRPPEEPRGFDEPEAARQIGLAYVNIPVTPATLDQAAIDRFLEAMHAIQPPLIVHGGTADRAAALLYAWLVLEKRETPARALERARAAGLRDPELAAKVRKLVAERKGPEPRRP
jgi:protein tyrosine phosphatase (PTP) superfamily phosphohydrolase (DUF442 family)